MTNIVRRRFALGTSGALALSGLFALSGAQASASGDALWVSTTGHDTPTCTHADPCRTIEHAVHLAPDGGTVKVEAGTYAGGVTIRKPLSLVGLGQPTIDASTSSTGNGILLDGPGASHSTVKGFTVMNAEFEGILAIGAPPTSGPVGRPITDVVISGNTVENNDTGFAAQAQGECVSPGPQIPAIAARDCTCSPRRGRWSPTTSSRAIPAASSSLMSSDPTMTTRSRTTSSSTTSSTAASRSSATARMRSR